MVMNLLMGQSRNVCLIDELEGGSIGKSPLVVVARRRPHTSYPSIAAVAFVTIIKLTIHIESREKAVFDN